MRFVAKLTDVPIEQVFDVAVVLPRQVVLLWRFYGAVAHPFGIVTRHH